MQSGKKTRLVALAVIGAAYAPLLGLHFRRLWTSDEYRYFPFLLAAVAMLFWARFGPHRAGDRSANAPLPLSAKWLVAALLTLAAAVTIWSPWLVAASFVIFAYQALRSLVGETGRSPVAVWALLLLLLPLPLGWDARLTHWVQQMASQAGGSLLDFLAVNHLRLGSVLYVPGREFAAQDVCVGVSSCFSLVALAAIAAVYLRRPLVHALLLLLAGGFWAAVLGGLELTSLVVLHTRYSVQASSGIGQVLLGILAFVVAALLLFCSDRFLLFLLAPIERERDRGGLLRQGGRPSRDGRIVHESSAVGVPDSPPAGASSRVIWIIIGCFAALAVAQILGITAGRERRLSLHAYPQQDREGP